MLAKHSKSFSLIDCISVGVDRMQRNFEPMRKQVESWQRSELTDVTAKVVIYEAFVESRLEAPKHLARTVHDLYFEPTYEEFRSRTIWSLSNAFTSAFKELDPIPQFRATAKLGEFLDRTSPGTWPGSRNSCTTRRASPSPTRSWKSCWPSCTSTGRRSTPAGSLAAASGAADRHQSGLPAGIPAARRDRRDRPWNYPVFTPMGSIVYALAAGNAVVFKPSELTPAVGGWLVSSRPRWFPQPVLQMVTGGGETGQALALSAVNKIAFTGSAATARKVMAACAENLTPLVAECGGKDALLVGADADLDAAADAAAWGALSNAGQTCVGVERVYVVDEVYHTFLEKLAERAAEVRPGEDREADYGPMTMPGQIEIIERHVADALARGASRWSAAWPTSAGATSGRSSSPTCRRRAGRSPRRRSARR